MAKRNQNSNGSSCGPSVGGRQLRSKESPKIDTSLFNYEENPDIVDPSQVFMIVTSMKDGAIVEAEPVPSTVGVENTIKVTEESDEHYNNKRSFRRTTSKKVNSNLKDPLGDELYEAYHRRMEKEEKKMTNRDREKIYSEADKMKAQLESLESTEWTKILPTVTYVRDPRDYEELVEKREWTIDSLKQLLSKFEEWKRREDKLLGRSKAPLMLHGVLNSDLRLYAKLHKYDYIGESDTDDEEEDLSIEEIKRKRIKKRVKQFGPIIKFKFGKSMVVAEPFRSTRIESNL